MKFGLSVPNMHPRRAAGLARLAEEAGWDGFFTGDAVWTFDPFVVLSAAAMLTQRIRLGTMVLALPRAVPWKLDSEITALDALSEGRLTVGLGAGAVWMGYQAFPDEVCDSRERAEWIDDGLAILNILARREQADYAGKHRSIRLTRLDTVHYPPPSVQRPRVPLWLVGAWPRQKSMRRVLGCDGWLAAGMDAQGHVAAATPADVRAGAAFLAANAAPGKVYDVIVEGNTLGQSPDQQRETLAPMRSAGATWWFETLWGLPEERWEERIRQGPPAL